jgi:hypothetical protein
MTLTTILVAGLLVVGTIAAVAYVLMNLFNNYLDNDR